MDFSRPNDLPVRLSVAMENYEHIRQNLWVPYAMCGMGLFSLLLGEILAGTVALVVFSAFILFAKRLYIRCQNSPTVLEAFDHGLWFNWFGVFVPYKDLVDVRVTRVRANLITMRGAVFTVRASDSERQLAETRKPFSLRIDNLFTPKGFLKIRLPAQDGVLSCSFEQIVATVSRLCHAHTASNGLHPATFSVAQ